MYVFTCWVLFCPFKYRSKFLNSVAFRFAL